MGRNLDGWPTFHIKLRFTTIYNNIIFAVVKTSTDDPGLSLTEFHEKMSRITFHSRYVKGQLIQMKGD